MCLPAGAGLTWLGWRCRLVLPLIRMAQGKCKSRKINQSTVNHLQHQSLYGVVLLVPSLSVKLIHNCLRFLMESLLSKNFNLISVEQGWLSVPLIIFGEAFLPYINAIVLVFLANKYSQNVNVEVFFQYFLIFYWINKWMLHNDICERI